VGEAGEEALAEVLEVFEVGLADLAEEQALETRETLAVVQAHLGEEPEGFAAAASAAEADGRGAIREVASAGGGTGFQLARLQYDADAVEILHLIEMAAGGKGGGGEAVGEI